MESLTKQNELVVSDKDKLFCYDYLTDFDATAAWKRQNPTASHKYAAQNASKLMKTPTVRQFLKQITGQKLAKIDTDAERMMKDLVGMAFFDPDDIMTYEDGEPKLDMSLLKDKPEIRRLLDISFGVSVTKDGDRIPTYSVKGYDKMAAMDRLIKLQALAQGLNPNENNRALHVHVNFPIAGQYRNAIPSADIEPIDPEDI